MGGRHLVLVCWIDAWLDDCINSTSLRPELTYLHILSGPEPIKGVGAGCCDCLVDLFVDDGLRIWLLLLGESYDSGGAPRVPFSNL